MTEQQYNRACEIKDRLEALGDTKKCTYRTIRRDCAKRNRR